MRPRDRSCVSIGRLHGLVPRCRGRLRSLRRAGRGQRRPCRHGGHYNDGWGRPGCGSIGVAVLTHFRAPAVVCAAPVPACADERGRHARAHAHPTDTQRAQTSHHSCRACGAWQHPACGVAGWIQSAKTSTFKFQKHVYAQDGFDPARVGGDALYFCDRSQPTVAYIPLDAPLYSNICAGAVRL